MAGVELVPESSAIRTPQVAGGGGGDDDGDDDDGLWEHKNVEGDEEEDDNDVTVAIDDLAVVDSHYRSREWTPAPRPERRPTPAPAAAAAAAPPPTLLLSSSPSSSSSSSSRPAPRYFVSSYQSRFPGQPSPIPSIYIEGKEEKKLVHHSYSEPRITITREADMEPEEIKIPPASSSSSSSLSSSSSHASASASFLSSAAAAEWEDRLASSVKRQRTNTRMGEICDFPLRSDLHRLYTFTMTCCGHLNKSMTDFWNQDITDASSASTKLGGHIIDSKCMFKRPDDLESDLVKLTPNPTFIAAVITTAQLFKLKYGHMVAGKLTIKEHICRDETSVPFSLLVACAMSDSNTTGQYAWPNEQAKQNMRKQRITALSIYAELPSSVLFS